MTKQRRFRHAQPPTWELDTGKCLVLETTLLIFFWSSTTTLIVDVSQAVVSPISFFASAVMFLFLRRTTFISVSSFASSYNELFDSEPDALPDELESLAASFVSINSIALFIWFATLDALLPSPQLLMCACCESCRLCSVHVCMRFFFFATQNTVYVMAHFFAIYLFINFFLRFTFHV